MNVTLKRHAMSDLWLARVLWLIAAGGFGMAAAGHVVLYRAFAQYPDWLPDVDEPVLFGLLVPVFATIAYAAMALLTRNAVARAADYLVPATLFAVIICGFIGLLNTNGAWFTERAWDTYLMLLGGALVLSVGYVRESFRKTQATA